MSSCCSSRATRAISWWSGSTTTRRSGIRDIERIVVLVKGGDYAPGEVVGRAEVEGRGGILCLFKLAGNYSSSDLIEKIVRNF
ncbi:MAG: hypothetical protein NTW95_12210 [Candidatus Aminicenantes bacterium]|nr:hypothetical protein [Candidatus Aminicenantes bacterium]